MHGPAAHSPTQPTLARRILKKAKRVRAPVNRLLAAQSLVPVTPYLDPAHFPELEPLRRQWTAIRDEFLASFDDIGAIPSLSEISPDHRRIAPREKWRSLFLYAHGYIAKENCERCPVTAAALAQVPGVVVAFFSVFEPHTHVPAHRGVTRALINVHLGLLVPEGPARCEIRVDREARGWKPGEFLILDDTYEHEVWNQSDQPRVVLFVQIRRPLRWRGRALAGLFLRALRLTTYVQEARKAIGAVPVTRP